MEVAEKVTAEDDDALNDAPWYKTHIRYLTRSLTERGEDFGQRFESVLVPFGEHAFPVAANAFGDVVVAAGVIEQVSKEKHS